MRQIDADAFKAEGRELYKEAGWDLREVHYSQLDMECNIDMMPTIEAEPKWIPIKEREPDLWKNVLVTLKWVRDDVDPVVVALVRGQDAARGGQFEDRVTAWMPLPEPYREVEE